MSEALLARAAGLLDFLAARLVAKYGENENVDFVLAAREVAAALQTQIAATQQQTAQERVLRMRDDFILLVSAYNEAHLFVEACGAQKIAMVLHQFENEEILTDVAWPPRADPDNGGLVQVERG
jgi:hypothetical protein